MVPVSEMEKAVRTVTVKSSLAGQICGHNGEPIQAFGLLQQEPMASPCTDPDAPAGPGSMLLCPRSPSSTSTHMQPPTSHSLPGSKGPGPTWQWVERPMGRKSARDEGLRVTHST